MKLFTIVLDWLEEETLMFQVEGTNAKSATEKWVANVSLEMVPGLSAEGLPRIGKGAQNR